MNFAEMKSEIFETTDRVRDGDGFFSKEALEKYDKLFDNVSKNESQEISVVREGVSYGDRMKKYAEMFCACSRCCQCQGSCPGDD